MVKPKVDLFVEEMSEWKKDSPLKERNIANAINMSHHHAEPHHQRCEGSCQRVHFPVEFLTRRPPKASSGVRCKVTRGCLPPWV